jgi:hypothetical protein
MKPHNIQSIVLIEPLRVLDATQALRTEGVFREAWPNWKCTMISSLYNTPYSGTMIVGQTSSLHIITTWHL